MGLYWNGEGPHQVECDALRGKLIPSEGSAETIEAECLSAADCLGYEFFNNGGGNNVSGALIYLRTHLPEFKDKWWDALAPFVTGSGGLYCSEEQLSACEEILDATVVYVMQCGDDLRPIKESWRDNNVTKTGEEISDDTAEWMRDDEQDEFEELDSDDEELDELSGSAPTR